MQRSSTQESRRLRVCICLRKGHRGLWGGIKDAYHEPAGPGTLITNSNKWKTMEEGAGTKVIRELGIRLQ
jgi:hypothetical protein